MIEPGFFGQALYFSVHVLFIVYNIEQLDGDNDCSWEKIGYETRNRYRMLYRHTLPVYQPIRYFAIDIKRFSYFIARPADEKYFAA